MLFDTILAFPDSELAGKYIPENVTGFRELGGHLRQSQRFVLHRDAVMMTLNIAESSPKRFLSALGVCRLPFPKMWVEFVFKDREDWHRHLIEKGRTVVNRDDAPPPQRLGFYLEQQDDEGRSILVQPAWVHLDGSPSVCNLVYLINTDPSWKPSSEMLEKRRFDISKGYEKGWADSWIGKKDEIEAAVELECRLETIVPPWLRDTWRVVSSLGKEKFDHFCEMALYDLRSEWRFTLALLTMLNSRNVIEISPENDLSKLNKARTKSGKAPLLSSHDIRLSLSRVQRNRIGGSGAGMQYQAAIVRGHWKLRSSGLFWWNPYLRGTSEELPPRTYSVR